MANPMQRLVELGIALPTAPKPVAAYVPAVRSGNLLYVSGQLPMRDGKLLAVGPVPSAVGMELAVEAARQCGVNILAVAHAELGGLDRVVRVVRLGVFVASEGSFTEQPKVANGASELMQAVFGEAGRHTRAAVGTNVLPLGASVEVDAILEFRP
jgi:enamine deaminase RidA (YjgF/YER057c/UK114 family)